MSVTQGGQIPGQPGLIHRRHDAGEARDGGDARNRSTGHGSRRGWHRWNPEPRLRPLVLVGLPETTQIDGGVHFRGGRSSAKCGCGAAAHRWVNGGARQHLKAAGARRSYYAKRRCSGARSLPAIADGGFGRSRGSGYGARARERGEGKGRGAHGGLAEQAGVLGDVLRSANRRRWRRGRSPASVVKKTTASAMERVRRCVA